MEAIKSLQVKNLPFLPLNKRSLETLKDFKFSAFNFIFGNPQSPKALEVQFINIYEQNF